jgi:AraC-like DNA-binding protein
VAIYGIAPMLFLVHKPAPALARFVDHLWCLSDAPLHRREHIVPTGTLELVINLAEDEFRIYDREDPRSYTRFAGAMVSGAHSRYFVIDTREHASIMGVHFNPGGAVPFLGLPPGALADAHVELSELWGAAAPQLRERLCSASSPKQRFQLLEQALLRRLARSAEPRPAACAGLEWLGRGRRVGDVAADLALSRRRFITVFSEDIGLTPKLFARISRFERAVTHARRATELEWSQLALESGYFDQSHMIREFVEFSGFTPAALLCERPQRVKEHHVAIAEGSHSSNTRTHRQPKVSGRIAEEP